jgi:rhamnosyltransferase subunit B
MPPWALAVNYAPFDLLLPRLRALVHHGGIGTGAQALAAGLPQGFVPFAHDQFDNAQRWQQQGVGLILGRRGWARALKQLLNDPAIAAACAKHSARTQPAQATPDHIADRIAEHVMSLLPAAPTLAPGGDSPLPLTCPQAQRETTGKARRCP